MVLLAGALIVGGGWEGEDGGVVGVISNPKGKKFKFLKNSIKKFKYQPFILHRSFLGRTFKNYDAVYEKEGGRGERSLSVENHRGVFRESSGGVVKEESFDDDSSITSSGLRDKKKSRHKSHRSKETRRGVHGSVHNSLGASMPKGRKRHKSSHSEFSKGESNAESWGESEGFKVKAEVAGRHVKKDSMTMKAVGMAKKKNLKDGVKAARKKNGKKGKHSPTSPSIISSSSSPSILSSSSSSSVESVDSKVDARGNDEVTDLEKKKQKLLEMLNAMEQDDDGGGRKNFSDDAYKSKGVKTKAADVKVIEASSKQKKVSRGEKSKSKLKSSNKETVQTIAPVDLRYSPASDVSSNELLPEGDERKGKGGSQESTKPPPSSEPPQSTPIPTKNLDVGASEGTAPTATTTTPKEASESGVEGNKPTEPRYMGKEKKVREVMCLPLPRFAFDLPALRKKSSLPPPTTPKTPKTPTTPGPKSLLAPALAETISPLLSPPITTLRTLSESSEQAPKVDGSKEVGQEEEKAVPPTTDQPLVAAAVVTSEKHTSTTNTTTTTTSTTPTTNINGSSTATTTTTTTTTTIASLVTTTITATTTTTIIAAAAAAAAATTATTTTVTPTTTTTTETTAKQDNSHENAEESTEDISNSLEERIRLLDEKLSKIQQGVSRLPSSSSIINFNADHSTTSANSTTPSSTLCLDYREKYKRHRRDPLTTSHTVFTTLSGTTPLSASLESPFRPEPSDLAKIFLSRSSIFDQDSKRLEMLNRIPLQSDTHPSVPLKTSIGVLQGDPAISTTSLHLSTTTPRSSFFTRSSSIFHAPLTPIDKAVPHLLSQSSFDPPRGTAFSAKTSSSSSSSSSCASGDPRRAARADHSSALNSPPAPSYSSSSSSFKWSSLEEASKHSTTGLRVWPSAPPSNASNSVSTTAKPLTSPPVSILKKHPHKDDKPALLPTPTTPNPANSATADLTTPTTPSTTQPSLNPPSKRKADGDSEATKHNKCARLDTDVEHSKELKHKNTPKSNSQHSNNNNSGSTTNSTNNTNSSNNSNSNASGNSSNNLANNHTSNSASKSHLNKLKNESKKIVGNSTNKKHPSQPHTTPTSNKTKSFSSSLSSPPHHMEVKKEADTTTSGGSSDHHHHPLHNNATSDKGRSDEGKRKDLKSEVSRTDEESVKKSKQSSHDSTAKDVKAKGVSKEEGKKSSTASTTLPKPHKPLHKGEATSTTATTAKVRKASVEEHPEKKKEALKTKKAPPSSHPPNTPHASKTPKSHPHTPNPPHKQQRSLTTTSGNTTTTSNTLSHESKKTPKHKLLSPPSKAPNKARDVCQKDKREVKALLQELGGDDVSLPYVSMYDMVKRRSSCSVSTTKHPSSDDKPHKVGGGWWFEGRGFVV